MTSSDRELKVELRVRDVNGREAFYAVAWRPFGPASKPVHITTGLTDRGPDGVSAELMITDPLGEEE